MRTRARLIATIAVCFWLSLAAGNHLAANQGFDKPTEKDIRIDQELEGLERRFKEREKVLEKRKKQDEEDLAKRIAQDDEVRRTRRHQGKLISGGLIIALMLFFRAFKKAQH